MPVNSTDVQGYLATQKDPKARGMASDFELVAALTKTINASLAFAEAKSPLEFLAVGAEKFSSVSDIADKTVNSDGFKAGNFVVSQVSKSVQMGKYLGMASPGKAVTLITLAAAEKIVMTAGFAGFDKCKAAVAQLALTSTVTVVTGWTGIGGVIGGIAILADAMNVYGACYAE